MFSETGLWIIFGVVVAAALVFDLFIFQRKSHIVAVKEALRLVAFWVFLALAFNALVYFTQGPQKGLEFLTAYLVEYSLSIDNLFVFLAIFTYFAVPREAQRKVLLWGILGAVFFRAIFIFAGIALIERFEWLIYILGVLLLYTAYRLVTQKDKEIDPERNPIVRFTRRFIRCDTKYHGSNFTARVDGLFCATPLLIVLLAVETTDVMFAVDSVPAVFGVTLDPFIVYTSNIFAILGLRALFFALAGMFYLFRYLVYGLCLVLAFVGVKMLISHWYQIPVAASLGVVFALILVSVILSIVARKREGRKALDAPEPTESNED